MSGAPSMSNEKAAGQGDAFLFVLHSGDMLEFFEGWPDAIALAVLREPDQDSYYLLPEENLIRDITGVIDGRDLPVFPEMEGWSSVRISFSEESDIIGRVARRQDLLENALSMRERLDSSGPDAASDRAALPEDAGTTPDTSPDEAAPIPHSDGPRNAEGPEDPAV